MAESVLMTSHSSRNTGYEILETGIPCKRSTDSFIIHARREHYYYLMYVSYFYLQPHMFGRCIHFRHWTERVEFDIHFSNLLLSFFFATPFFPQYSLIFQLLIIPLCNIYKVSYYKSSTDSRYTGYLSLITLTIKA